MVMDITVIDNALDNNVLKACINEAETQKSYYCMHPGGDGTYGFKYNWTFRAINRPESFTNEPMIALWKEVKKHLPENAELFRGYVNAHQFGVEDNLHSDDPLFDNGYTVIVYLTSTWQASWGGQTMFYDNFTQEDNEIVRSVLPRYNRMVIFDKNLPHAVAPLSKRFTGVRFTCMFKVKIDEPA